MRLRRLAFASALLAAAAPALAGSDLPPETVAAIEKIVAAEMAASSLPGVAVGVWIPNEGAYVAATGVANLESGAARDVGDPFRIGSVTKTMIGTVVLQLADEGALSLDAPIATWFPDFPNGDAITVDDLLRMRSGIPDFWTDEAVAAYYADPLHPPSMAEMIDRSAAAGDRFEPPDGATVYANVNFLLLDRIVAEVSGTTTAEALAARVFAPLDMADSEYATGTDVPGPLRGYGRNAATGAFEDKTAADVEPVGGAGAAISTLADLERFVRALCAGTLVEPATQERRLKTEAFRGAPEIVRYGEAVTTIGPYCGHNGTIMGFSTEAWYLPSRDAVIAVSVNRLDADDRSMSTSLFEKIAAAVFPDETPW